MKISVIIPVYNVETYLRECLDSVISQTYQDWEAIMVDDCSTDNSRAICEEYLAKDNRFRLVSHTENRGLSAARNTGLDHTKGDCLCFLDSDDMLHPEFMKSLSGKLSDNKLDIISCLITDRKIFSQNKGYYQSITESGDTFLERCLYQSDKGHNHSAWGKLFKNSVFSKIYFTESILYEDLEISPRVWTPTCMCSTYFQELYFYRKNPQSILHTFSHRRADVLDVTEKIETEMRQQRPRLLPAASDRALSAAFNILGLMAANNYRDKALESRCIGMIKKRRVQSFLNPKVRLKNKIGILITYLAGFSGYKKIARHIYRH